MSRAVLALVIAASCVCVALGAVQIVSFEQGFAPPAKLSLVHIDPWTGEVRLRVPVNAARNITRPRALATHSPASEVAPFQYSALIGSTTDRTHGTLIVFNARTLEPSGAHPDLPVNADIIGLVFDKPSAALWGFEVDVTVTPRTHWFGQFSETTGKMIRHQQIPAPYTVRQEYDWALNTVDGVLYAVLDDARVSCAFATFDVRNPQTRPKIITLPTKTCLHNLMYVEPESTGKPGTLISFCTPDFPHLHNATLCTVDASTGKTEAVSKVFTDQADNFHTAVAFAPGWVYASGLSRGRQWLFNYAVKNVTELPTRVPAGYFFAGGSQFTL